MKDEAKTKAQLIIELHELRKRVRESEKGAALLKRLPYSASLSCNLGDSIG